jgi:prepilin-type N-terminal cleavage/methylation domain-containing protein
MKKSIKGFTLVELLVALAISGLVLGAVFKIFNTSQQNYVVQEEVAEMQQNLRVAKMFLERDVRMAGAGIMDVGDLIVGGTTFSKPEILTFTNGGTDDPDALKICYATDSSFGSSDSCGEDPSGTLPSCNDYPQLTLTSDMPTTSAEAIVTEDLTSSPQDIWGNAGCYCAGDSYTTPTFGLPMAITSPDGSRTEVVFLTGVQENSDKLQNGSNFSYTGTLLPNQTYTNKVLNTFPAGSTVNFLENSNAIATFNEISYYIDEDDPTDPNDPTFPRLYRRYTSADGATTVQLIAEHIEDLQFSFWKEDGVDNDGDGEIDEADELSWDSTTSPLNEDSDTDIRMIRVSLVARSKHEHRNFTGNRPALEDHSAGTTDGFRRRVLTFTVKVRNFGLD